MLVDMELGDTVSTSEAMSVWKIHWAPWKKSCSNPRILFLVPLLSQYNPGKLFCLNQKGWSEIHCSKTGIHKLVLWDHSCVPEMQFH